MTDRDKGVARGPAKGLTREFLATVALEYLNRFDATEAKFKAMLWRRARRAAQLVAEEARPAEAELQEWITDLTERYRAVGLVSDARYADNVARSLRQRGLSARAIAARLRAKGVSGEAAESALTALDGGEADAEFQAALRFARRKRLGSFRRGDGSLATRQRELAALARAGFSFDIARKVLEAEADDEEDPTARGW